MIVLAKIFELLKASQDNSLNTSKKPVTIVKTDDPRILANKSEFKMNVASSPADVSMWQT